MAYQNNKKIVVLSGLFCLASTGEFAFAQSAPVLNQVYAVPLNGNNPTPHYTFNSSQSGRIIYSGDCISATKDAMAGNNTVAFEKLSEGKHANCKIEVMNTAKAKSIALAIPTFNIDSTPPVLTQTTPVPEVTNDLTPNLTFTSTEAGKIIYEGDCYSSANETSGGAKTISFATMSAGEHKNCKISVRDAANNLSHPLELSPFTIDTSQATLKLVEGVPANTSASSPTLTISSSKDGTFLFSGDCSSSQTSATAGNNSITLNSLKDGWHKNCTVSLIDSVKNVTDPLSIPEFRVDTTVPEIKEASPIESPSKNTTPEFSFTSTESGTIVYGGDCSSTKTIATPGVNKVIFNKLADGQYSSCTVEVKDDADNTSSLLSVSTFFIDTTPPALSVVKTVPDNTTDTTPDVGINTNEAGTLNFSGDCKSSDTKVPAGNKTITFNSLYSGTHNNCKISLTDEAGNTSPDIAIPSFTIKGFTIPKVDNKGFPNLDTKNLKK